MKSLPVIASIVLSMACATNALAQEQKSRDRSPAAQTPSASMASGEVQRVVVQAKRMSRQEIAAYDAWVKVSTQAQASSEATRSLSAAHSKSAESAATTEAAAAVAAIEQADWRSRCGMEDGKVRSLSVNCLAAVRNDREARVALANALNPDR